VKRNECFKPSPFLQALAYISHGTPSCIWTSLLGGRPQSFQVFLGFSLLPASGSTNVFRTAASDTPLQLGTVTVPKHAHRSGHGGTRRTGTFTKSMLFEQK